MDIALNVFVLCMLPVLFFGVIAPFLKFGFWICLDVMDSRWYGIMTYMIIAFWGLGAALSACYFWMGYWHERL